MTLTFKTGRGCVSFETDIIFFLEFCPEMDSDGLPLVGPGLDYTKVGAIHQKRTLAFLNHFVTHTARFLNRFSCVCEQKLYDLNVRLHRLETTMSLLETKLASIPGLENITAPTSQQPTTQQQAGNNPTTTATPSQGPATAPEAQQEVPEPPPESNQPKISEDPRYARFFKMVNMGVPAVAVKLKMQSEGFNPDLLDDPNAPAPAGGTITNNADSSNSDSDMDSDDSSDFSD